MRPITHGTPARRSTGIDAGSIQSAQTKPRSKKQVARIEHRQKSRETAHTPSAGLRSFTEPFIDPGAERRTRWPNPGYTRSPVHSAGCNDGLNTRSPARLSDCRA